MPRAHTQTVQTPGAEGENVPEQDKDALIAELQAQIAAQKLPQVVYEPTTPKGKQALEASQFAHFTVAQLMAAIDAGEAKEPITSVLCSDGYYARRR
jgi:hypothetical protein